MTVSQTIVTTPAVTATGTLKRTVSDQIRRLNPVVTPLMAIVKTSNVDKMGTQTTGEGLISKNSTDTMKFEWFTYTPIDLYALATADGTAAIAGAETGTATIADNTAFRPRDIVTNLRTLEVAIVNALSSTTGLVLTAVSTWTCLTGDTIAMSCRTMEEGTSDITPLTKEPDNNYNYVFPFRYPITIADTALNSPHYGGDLLKRYMTDNSTFALRNLENAFFLGQRAASETTTVTISATAYALYTTRGILNYATSPIDAGGAMSFDKWCTTVFEGLPNTQSPDRLLVMPMGRKIYGRMQAWANQKLIQWESGKQDTFGVQTEKFFCGPYTIKPMLHDLFDHGNLANCAVIFDPTDLTYRFKTGMDVQPKDNLQLPATWGTTRAIQGVTGLQCWSGGYNVRLITGWNQ